MSEPFVRAVATHGEAHEAVIACYAVAKSLIFDDKRVRMTVEEDHDPMSAKQRRFLHGPVLAQISEQARGDDGQRYLPLVWKEVFRAQFLGSTWARNPLGAHLPSIELRNSTEDQNTREYSDYIDRVIDNATLDWGVTFVFKPRDREEVRYRPKAKPVKTATLKEPLTC